MELIFAYIKKLGTLFMTKSYNFQMILKFIWRIKF